MAAIPGSDDGLLGSNQAGSEPNYVASLGRISGKLLSENLERQGVDLTFRNGSADPDLLYLDVTNMRLGVEGKRTLPATLTRASGSLPVYDLDVNDTVKSIFTTVDTQANIDNLTFNANGTIGSVTGPIIIETTTTSTVIPYAKLLSDYLVIDGNVISSISNNNIRLDPSGTGITRIDSSARVTGNLQVQGVGKGDITVNGDLSSATDIIVGDTSLDTVTVTPDFTQSIIPGIDLTYDLGQQANDSSPRRWSELQSRNLSTVVTNRPNAVKVSDQLWLDGTINKISGLQSNEDVDLLPDTGITYIESTKWQASDITNLLNTPLTFASTGIGYTRIMGDNAFLIPAGPEADRRASPEVGETRWNTDESYLECFDGSVWAVATGGGVEVSTTIMEDLSHVWILTLG
jgi:hypothetical protein